VVLENATTTNLQLFGGGTMEKAEIEGGLEEMNFTMVDNGIMELPSSKPATYEFVEESEYAPEQFEAEIEDVGFSIFTASTEQREDGAFYYYVDVLTDHAKRVKIRVWNDTVRIYPREEPPDTWEFSRIVQAVETAFGELQHAPEKSRTPRAEETA
jgi:hypothetical protein